MSRGDYALIRTDIRALSPREHALLVLLYRMNRRKVGTCHSEAISYYAQTVQVNVDIGNYVVLGLRNAPPPPPPSGFKPLGFKPATQFTLKSCDGPKP